MSYGILQPKAQHHFRVMFKGFGHGAQRGLTQQVASVSQPVKAAGSEKWSNEPIGLVFRDDITSVVQQAVYQAITGKMLFYMEIQQLLPDNDEVIGVWALDQCAVQSCSYSNLDYAADKAVMISLKISFLEASWRQSFSPEQIERWRDYLSNDQITRAERRSSLEQALNSDNPSVISTLEELKVIIKLAHGAENRLFG